MKLSLVSEAIKSSPMRIGGMEALDAALESARLRDEMEQMGLDCKELDVCLDNILMSLDVLQKEGVRAFHYMIDEDNGFAKHFKVTEYVPGLTDESLESLKAEYIDAAQEGFKDMMKNFWEGIKKY